MTPSPEQIYRERADFLLRENMQKLKGLVDLLCLGVLDDMDQEEREEFLRKIQQQTDILFEKLEASITLQP
jgi:hypothetical protein